jgi:hypothetical protein
VIDPDIKKFVDAIGAKVPLAESESYFTFRRMFKRQNYFTLNNQLLVVKISRSKKPFWGLTKSIIDFLNGLNEYSVVLLTSPTEGWVFSKSQVNAHVGSGRWALREADGNFKINMPLPDSNMFSTVSRFLSKVGAEA